MSLFKKFTTLDLVIISICSATGLALKPLLSPLVHIISSPLLIPGGSLIGGIYMIWIVLGAFLVNKTGAAFSVGFIQGLVIMVIGLMGSHGGLSLLIYLIPGLLVDIVLLIFRFSAESIFSHALLNIVANLSGVLIVSVIVLRLPLIPLLLSISACLFSSFIGGFISYEIYKQVRKVNIL